MNIHSHTYKDDTHTHTYTHTFIYLFEEREIYFNELGHMIVGAGKFEICRAGQQARNLGRSCLVLRQILLFQETLVFTLKAFS